MKKLLAIILLCGILTACGAQTGETLPTETTEPPVVGLYDPENPVEKDTDGAVKAYPLEFYSCTDILSMGDKLVLFSENSLTVLQGEQCEVVAELDVKLDRMSVSAAETGIAYYDAEENRIVLLNPLLQQSTTFALPEKIQGKPVINLSAQEAFYCDGSELRALNLQSGISRLIRNFAEQKVELVDLQFGGTVLRCIVTENDDERRMYLSAQTGQTLSEDESLSILESYGKEFFALRNDGPVGQRIFGTQDGQVQCLNLDDTIGEYATSALSLGGVVCAAINDSGIALNYYDLQSGKKVAATQLDDVARYITFHADSRYIWVVGSVNNRENVLYRWDIELSPVEDETVYTGPFYTAENPDEAGLLALKKRADEMNKTYGVRISVWDEAVKKSGNYTLVPEYHVPSISEKLDELEVLLAQFPPKFLQVTVEAGWIRLCLVRSIESGEPYVQYWSGGDCYGAISMYADMTEAFLMCASYGIDTHVMGNSRDFDTWNKLNPSGFSYGQEVNEKYLEGDSRAFVNAEAMENPHEDRSRIIAYAMMNGNAELFASATMQAKLLRACEGIREAYGLEKSPETYLWEQYLNKSLAYKK